MVSPSCCPQHWPDGDPCSAGAALPVGHPLTAGPWCLALPGPRPWCFMSLSVPTVRGSASRARAWCLPAPHLLELSCFRFVLYSKINFYTPCSCTPCPVSPGEAGASSLPGLQGSRASPRAWAAPFEGNYRDLGQEQSLVWDWDWPGLLGETDSCATSAIQRGETGKEVMDPLVLCTGSMGSERLWLPCGSLCPPPCGVWGFPLPCRHFPLHLQLPGLCHLPSLLLFFPWQLLPQLFLSLQPQPRALGTGNVGAAGEKDFPEPLH